MNNLTTWFDRLGRALAELTPARRVLAGTLVAVMIVSGVWAISRRAALLSGGGASSSRMEPVLDQPFTRGDVDRITRHLKAESVPHEIADGRVLVPADRRLDVLSDLFYAGILGGSGNESGFDALVRQMSAWDAPSKTDKLFNHYREETLARVIAGYDGVRKATVIIDPTSERRLGGDSVQPRAMVDVQTRSEGSVDSRQIAEAAANALTGAIANLSRDNVRITIDGATYNLDATAAALQQGPADLVARKHQSEQMHAAKVRQLLSYCGDVLVSVSVDLDVPVPATDDAETAAAGTARGEAVANAIPVMTDTTSAKPPVRVEMVRSASVAVPRSYFVSIYRRANTGTQEPTDALLQPVVDAYSLRIRNLVKNALGVADDEAVAVEHYEDALPTLEAATAAAAVAAASIPPTGAVTAGPTARPMAAVTANLNTYAKEIALATLAAVVLLALSLIVRRRPAPAPVMVDAHGRQHAAGGRDVVHGTLEDDRDEVPGDDAEAHQLFRRVRDMAQEHPDDAARVLRGWIYQQD